MALALSILAKIGSGAPNQNPGPPPVPTPLRIGDDACAVMLEVRARVIDAEKRPVEGAKVFFRHGRESKPHLDLVGITDGRGQLVKSICYQATGEYYDSPPKGEVALAFVVSTWRYKDHEVRRVVGADALLREGLLFSQVRPRLVPRPGLKQDAAFRIKFEVVLRDVA